MQIEKWTWSRIRSPLHELWVWSLITLVWSFPCKALQFCSLKFRKLLSKNWREKMWTITYCYAHIRMIHCLFIEWIGSSNKENRRWQIVLELRFKSCSTSVSASSLEWSLSQLYCSRRLFLQMIMKWMLVPWSIIQSKQTMTKTSSV